MNKAEILVIDDEASIRKLLEITMSTHDYKVILAQTGKEGIQLAVNHSPDLIILDLGLPDKNGHEVLKELREWYTKGILILSVQNSENDIVKALDNGANDYLTKPFRNAELLARIRSILRRNQTAIESSCLRSGEARVGLSEPYGETQPRIDKTHFYRICFIDTFDEKRRLCAHAPIYIERNLGSRLPNRNAIPARIYSRLT